jgi:hypothetical protein
MREVHAAELVKVEGGGNPLAVCLSNIYMMAACGLIGVGTATWLLMKAYGWKLKQQGKGGTYHPSGSGHVSIGYNDNAPRRF